jgi:hypothetical protein
VVIEAKSPALFHVRAARQAPDGRAPRYHGRVNFRLWAHTVAAATGRYFVNVSAVSDEDPDRTGGVETGEAATLVEAEALRDQLVARMTERLESRGHRVVSVRFG